MHYEREQPGRPVELHRPIDGGGTVQVKMLGEEFVRGVEGECVAEDFPSPGETVTLEWQQNSQNFAITQVE